MIPTTALLRFNPDILSGIYSHSLCDSLSGILSGIYSDNLIVHLTFYLAFTLTVYLIAHLTFHLAYTQTFYLTVWHSFWQTFFLAFYLAPILAFFLAAILTFFLAFYIWHCSDVLSDIPFWHCIWNHIFSMMYIFLATSCSGPGKFTQPPGLTIWRLGPGILISQYGTQVEAHSTESTVGEEKEKERKKRKELHLS